MLAMTAEDLRVRLADLGVTLDVEDAGYNLVYVCDTTVKLDLAMAALRGIALKTVPPAHDCTENIAHCEICADYLSHGLGFDDGEMEVMDILSDALAIIEDD